MALQTTDQFLVSQGNQTYKVTLQSISDKLQDTLSFPPQNLQEVLETGSQSQTEGIQLTDGSTDPFDPSVMSARGRTDLEPAPTSGSNTGFTGLCVGLPYVDGNETIQGRYNAALRGRVLCEHLHTNSISFDGIPALPDTI